MYSKQNETKEKKIMMNEIENKNLNNKKTHLNKKKHIYYI